MLSHAFSILPLSILVAAASDLTAQQSPRVHVLQIPDVQYCRECTIDRRLVATLRDDSLPGSVNVFTSVLESSDKRFILGSFGDATAPSVANRNGFAQRFIGRQGRGPCEYIGLLMAYETRNAFYIADVFQKRWTRLSKDLKCIASVRLPITNGYRALFDNGNYVIAGFNPTKAGATNPFHLISAEGEIIRSFGGTGVPLSPKIAWPLTLSSNNTIWAAERNRYRIEGWDSAGHQTAAFERQVKWFPNRDPIVDNLEWPHVFYIYSDDAGLIWVHLSQAHPKKTWIEVLDLSRGRLVATAQFENVLWTPVTRMPGGRGYHAYSYRENDVGEPFIDVYALELKRPNNPQP